MDALKRANDVRVKRAKLKKDLKDGKVRIEQILGNPPEYVSTAKVIDILMAVPKFGRGEEDGREYWFLSDEDFLARVGRGEFLEHVEFVSGHRYGTLRSELDRIAANGHVPLLELETEGALRVKHGVRGAVTIFISARVDELERRLRERATESAGEIHERIEHARKQLEQ